VVDDASTDGSLEWLRAATRKDQRVRYVSFVRNLCHQVGVTVGLHNALGDAVITMDADLQDLPAVILQMIQKWKKISDSDGAEGPKDS
jgi:glycosyltransferase involved in cell wall biosynthesis